ncbi:lipase 1-like [Epargyreus clarus]|uniref:lipase 1-like n=1 Tax=Epargyreus clarus TaxID=520877 RepID=UPI003C2CE55C
MCNGLHFVIFIIVQIHIGACLALTNLFLGEDALLNFTQLASKYDQPAEQYEVVTEDGYVLTLFRLPGFRQINQPPTSLPILLMHGICDSSDTWILRGYESLAITLANGGHDVWLGNARGNRYSRKHLYLNPDKDSTFWDFTFNEIGMFDLTSLIDFVLLRTGAAKLNAIGHSQGTTIFFVLGSTRTEYNFKINVLIALAPICYLQNVPNPLATLIKFSPLLYSNAKKIGLDEFPGKIIGKTFLKLCSKPVAGYVKCVFGINFPLAGYDSEELEPAFFRVSLGHFPTGTSAKNLYHFGQVGRRRSFSRFDYGPTRNLELYGSEIPPYYDLGQVTMKVVLFVGKNDFLSVIKDVALLRVQLPNVVEYTEIERKLMNHVDFTWGRTMKDYLFPNIFRVLNMFRWYV